MIFIYVTLQLALILLSMGGYFQVKKFLGLYSSVSEKSHLSAFKSLVRTNMYIALIYLALAIPTVLFSLSLGFAYGFLGVASVLIINIPLILFGRHLKSLEVNATRLQCSADLSDEYHRIGETWFKKALPDF